MRVEVVVRVEVEVVVIGTNSHRIEDRIRNSNSNMEDILKQQKHT